MGGSPEPTTGGSTTPTPGTTPPTAGTPPEPMIVVSRIDAFTKIVGREQSDTHENVHSGDVLPSRRAPVVLFLRNVDSGTAAQFIVSRNVSNVNGEGTCKPGKSNCEFLTLNEGDTAYLRYADGHRLRPSRHGHPLRAHPRERVRPVRLTWQARNARLPIRSTAWVDFGLPLLVSRMGLGSWRSSRACPRGWSSIASASTATWRGDSSVMAAAGA